VLRQVLGDQLVDRQLAWRRAVVGRVQRRLKRFPGGLSGREPPLLLPDAVDLAPNCSNWIPSGLVILWAE
jgi:hypothetical protein